MPSKTAFLKSSRLSCGRKKNSRLLFYKQMFLVMKTWNMNLNWMSSTSWKLVCWHEASKNNGKTKQWSSHEFRILPWAVQIHKESTKVRHSILLQTRWIFVHYWQNKEFHCTLHHPETATAKKCWLQKWAPHVLPRFICTRLRAKSRKPRNTWPSPDGSKTSTEKQQHLGFLTVTATQQPPELLNSNPRRLAAFVDV